MTCRCGHTREQHSQISTAAGCLTCIRCGPDAPPHLMTRCDCTSFTPAERRAPETPTGLA